MSKHRAAGTPVTIEQIAQEDRSRGLEHRYAKVVRAAKRGN